jgi:hypothetical protein
MAMPASLTPVQRLKLLMALHRDRIWLTSVDRLLWQCGWAVRPYAFQDLPGRLLRVGLILGLLLLWLWCGAQSWAQSDIDLDIFWLVPCLYVGAGLAGWSYHYLPMVRPGMMGWRGTQLRAHGLAGLAILLALWVWYHTIRQWGPIGDFGVVSRALRDGLMGGVAAAVIGPWRQRRRLRQRGLERWPVYVETALIEEVF